jgi:hypothetical protein
MLQTNLHAVTCADGHNSEKTQTEDTMKLPPQTYVLTLNSPSRRAVRLWTGKSIHALRHCSVKELNHALIELQQHVSDLQAPAQAPGASFSLNRSR